MTLKLGLLPRQAQDERTASRPTTPASRVACTAVYKNPARCTRLGCKGDAAEPRGDTTPLPAPFSHAERSCAMTASGLTGARLKRKRCFLQAARQSIVMLKRGSLPWPAPGAAAAAVGDNSTAGRKRQETIAVIGPLANSTGYLLGSKPRTSSNAILSFESTIIG